MNRRRFVVASAGTLALFHAPHTYAAPPAGIPADAVEAVFKSTIDGEKFNATVDGKDRAVRLIGVDAPEQKNKDGNPECFFDQSSKRLAQILTNHTIYLEKDQEDKDGKDRLWRHVWVVSASGKPLLVNEYLLTEGDAVTRTEDKNTKYHDRYVKAEQAAKAGTKGLWGMCGSAHVAITPVPRHGSGDDPGAIGETLEAEGMAVTLNSAYYDYSYGYTEPKKGYVFLIIEVTLKNVDPKDHHGYRDGRFSAKDLDSGADFDAVGSAMDEPLGSGDLSTGEYVTGIVGLEVQETAVNVRLKYQVKEIGGQSVYWLVPRQ